VSIPPHLRKPGSTLTRNQPYRGSVRRHASSGRPAIDRLVKQALGLVASCPFDAPRADVEAAIDYLTFREDFMALLELRAESLLRRRSAGPEDAEFEEIIVDALTLIQARLTEVFPDSLRGRGRLGDN
jgi:hypothetical protein